MHDHLGWQRDFKRAQAVKAYVIEARDFERIPYGSEEDDSASFRGPCSSCEVDRGSFHLLGCPAERCPRCGGQAISCDCFYEDRPGQR